jgi:NAD(P)-dependent dehydrogenase (short-subunit alcohol dehydrogenase family)
LDLDREGLERLCRDSAPGAFTAHTVDLADRGALDRLLSTLLGAGQRCDILVNNAGVSRLRSIEDTDDAVLDLLFAVNVTAAFRITRALLPALRASGHGAIVNIASELALVGATQYSAYCATKGAILAWSRALAVELAGDGIRVNAVCPGPIDTALLRAEFDTHGRPQAARAAETATVPLGRLGVPDDIAAVVAFLASDAAAFVTGAAWPVDGGKTAR